MDTAIKSQKSMETEKKKKEMSLVDNWVCNYDGLKYTKSGMNT